jgi:hypothetical protein
MLWQLKDPRTEVDPPIIILDPPSIIILDPLFKIILEPALPEKD